MNRKRISIATGLSLLLHASLFGLLAVKMPGCEQQGEGEGANGKDKPISIIAKIDNEPINVEMIELPLEKKKAVPAYQKATHKDKPCSLFYGGIGITTSGNYVTEVYPGYPADKAGFRAGMTILNSESIRGEIGTIIAVQIQEPQGVRVMELVRDKICYEDTP